ncbi:MAG: thymidine phosphorylase [Planctomycetota bacterium]
MTPGILTTKRDGGELSEEQIRAFMRGTVEGTLTDPQVVAVLAAVHMFGLTNRELTLWTRAMLESGEQLDLEGLGRPAADKHSTGGIGDKVSLALAPAVAACGVTVPMISGRALGHTGGTLDKLEAIPGLTTELSPRKVRDVLQRAGAAIVAQSAELVPADRRLYALRNAAGLIDSVPLIVSSILSKKLAEGLDTLVLDLKFGSGAFLVEPEEGRELGRTMLALAGDFGLHAVAFQTSMAQPLGRAVGGALEVIEAIECLSARGPEDLRELVVTFGAEMLVGAGAAKETISGRARIEEALDGGEARDVLARMVEAQGGDPRVVEDPGQLPQARGISIWCSPASGVLEVLDCRRIGGALAALGGAREVGSDGGPDPAVGLHWLRRAGEEVRAGDALAEIHYQDRDGLERAEAELAAAVGFEGGDPAPLILARLFPDDPAQ